MNDFIFGTLSTDELRRRHVLGLRSGVTHYHARSPRDPLPFQPVCLEMSVGPSIPGRKSWIYWTSDGTVPAGNWGVAENGFVMDLQPTGITWDTELWGYVRTFSVNLPGQNEDTVVRYRMCLEGSDGTEVFADQGMLYSYYVANDPTPQWAKDAIIYHIFVDRFNPGNGYDWKLPEYLGGFFGGRIRGITEKLNYIQSAGFNTLWLSPIFPSPSHHGYDATDLFEVEPRLGTKADLKDLVDACHERGMKVLLDFVPNHWSDMHPTFQAAIRDLNSPFRDWYTFKLWPDEYETFFGVKSLPKINLTNQDAREHVIRAAEYWLKLGVDGFRLDYAIGPTQDFWADFRQRTRKVKPECWTFGEIVDPPDEQIAFEGLLDGALDFILLEAIRQTIAFQAWSVEKFASFLERHEAFFPASFSRPSFLDNHDMNRFLWAVDGNLQKLKLAALCQFSLAGQPVVYYGTEVGLSQERDIRQGELGIPEEARQPMLWEGQQNQDLLGFYTELIRLRKEVSGMRLGERKTWGVDEQLLVYSRQSSENQALIILNIGPNVKVHTLPLADLNLAIETGGVQITCEEMNKKIVLPGWSGAILTFQETYK